MSGMLISSILIVHICIISLVIAILRRIVLVFIVGKVVQPLFYCHSLTLRIVIVIVPITLLFGRTLVIIFLSIIVTSLVSPSEIGVYFLRHSHVFSGFKGLYFKGNVCSGSILKISKICGEEIRKTLK